MDLQELLDRISEVTDEELATLVEHAAELSDDGLDALREKLRASYAEARNTDDPSDEVLDSMTSLADAIKTAKAESDVRAEAAAERAARAAAIDAEVAAMETEPSAEGEGAGDNADADGHGDNPEAEGDPAPAEGDPAPDANAAAEVPEVATPEAPAAEATPELAVVASAPARTRPRISRLAARRPADQAPVTQDTTPHNTITASGDVPGFSAGSAMSGWDDVATALAEKYNRFGTRGGGGEGYYNVARVNASFDESRKLRPDMSVEQVQAIIDGVISPASIQAAGGLCAPVTPYYDLAVIANAARPVQAALAGFDAGRGGIQFVAPPKLSDVATSVGEWTVTNDANPTSPATKARVRVTCPGITTVNTEAVTSRVEFGNFGARTFPEQVRAWMALAMAQHARIAETALLTAIGAGSTAVTGGAHLGAARDVLSTLDRAAAGIRSFNRTDEEMPLRLIYPTWLEDMMREDQARQLPGDSTDAKERLAVSDALINSWFAERNINATRTLDGISGQVFSQQSAAPLNAWPSTAVMYLFPEGSHLYLDGGTLDLGLVRDSTLNATNDFEMFSESFEGVATVGVVSYKITQAVCPDGSTSGTRSLTLCPPGS